MKSTLAGFYSCKVKDVEDNVLAETGCYLNVKDFDYELQSKKDNFKYLFFKTLPKFTNELNDSIVIREGDKLNLICRLNDDCEPKPSVYWFKDGKDITNSKYYRTTYVSRTGECRLVVDSSDKHYDQGVYTCAITLPHSPKEVISKSVCKVKITSPDDVTLSDSSSEDKSSQVEVITKGGPGAGIAPMFLQSLEDTELEEGEHLEIKCQIMGAPIPDISCYFTKDIGAERGSIKKVKPEFINYNCENGICRISFSNVSYNLNDGFYMVKAINEAGSLTTACRVNVRQKSYPPLILETDCGPSFPVQLPVEIKVMDGQEISLTCICAAKPEPTISWLRSTVEKPDEFKEVVHTSDLRASFDHITGKCNLKINDIYPQDSGVYKCVATNQHGTAQTSTNLIVECK